VRKLKEASISLLAVLNLHADAVKIALELDELEVVRKYADLPDLGAQRRELWLIVAQELIKPYSEFTDLKDKLKFLLSSPCLQLDDILPLLPKTLKIKDLKPILIKGIRKRTAKL